LYLVESTKQLKTKQKNNMYTNINFKSKKQLKEALTAGREISFYQPNQMFASKELEPNYSGTICLEGPHYPEPHKWYATAHVVNGKIVKVA
jgi:hypothetical protein